MPDTPKDADAERLRTHAEWINTFRIGGPSHRGEDSSEGMYIDVDCEELDRLEVIQHDLIAAASRLDTRAIPVGEREKELSQELKDRQATFDICWKADMRAIKRWQEETGRTLTWPDRADMVVWLLKKLDERGGL